jgi:hypothetical protein
MTTLKNDIMEILRQYLEECRTYTQEAAMEGNPTPDDIVQQSLLSAFQTAMERCVPEKNLELIKDDEFGIKTKIRVAEHKIIDRVLENIKKEIGGE